jgi:hypothetical protein
MAQASLISLRRSFTDFVYSFFPPLPPPPPGQYVYHCCTSGLVTVYNTRWHVSQSVASHHIYLYLFSLLYSLVIRVSPKGIELISLSAFCNP